MTNFVEVWRSYDAVQKRNIGIYIAGIMFYKFALEFFNGSISTLAADRFKGSAFEKLGAAQGLNAAMQCVGAILIAPLVKAFPTRTVLSGAVIGFAVVTAILLIIDAGTGGEFKSNGEKHYGSWNPNLIFLLWSIAGIFYGMVELIRRVIPADIVGGHVSKLRRMDATVHCFYEVAGTAAAFSSASAISRWGNNYSYFLTPVFFTFAGATWIFISTLSFKSEKEQLADGSVGAPLAEVERQERKKSSNYFVQVGVGAWLFLKSILVGGQLIFGHRKFIWLVPSYALALYLHRFLESSLGTAFAKRTLGNSAWSQIITGGSNFGELLGAASVFLLSDYVPTPLPWLRLDALALNIVWILPYFATRAPTGDVTWAWKIAGCFLPVSFGWAAGDVSLAAYIQSALSNMDLAEISGVSPLGAVMAFLYSFYVTLNAIFSSVLGKFIDRDFKANDNIKFALTRVAGLQYSICCGVILLATLIPLGALSLNPKIINDEVLEGDPAIASESLGTVPPLKQRDIDDIEAAKAQAQASEKDSVSEK